VYNCPNASPDMNFIDLIFFHIRTIVHCVTNNILVMLNSVSTCRFQQWCSCTSCHYHGSVFVCWICNRDQLHALELWIRIIIHIGVSFKIILGYELCSLLKALLWLYSVEQQYKRCSFKLNVCLSVISFT
jgi:hypothetical protein